MAEQAGVLTEVTTQFGSSHAIRCRFANRFYTARDSNHFDGGGFLSWGGENHFLDLVDGRGYLTVLGYCVLMDRQEMLDQPTPFNPNLRVTDVGKRLIRVADRPDLLARWPAAMAASRR